MRLIKIFINYDPIIYQFEINKRIIELYDLKHLSILGLDKETQSKLEKSILRAQEKKLDSFKMKY